MFSRLQHLLRLRRLRRRLRLDQPPPRNGHRSSLPSSFKGPPLIVSLRATGQEGETSPGKDIGSTM